MSQHLLLVGCGRMGGAMLAGWQAVKLGFTYHVVDPVAEPKGEVTVHRSLEELPNDFVPSIVVIAIKPQMWAEHARSFAQFDKALIISVMAGKTLEDMTTPLGSEKVIRAMPNLPAMVGKGATACIAAEGCNDEDKKNATNLFNANGATVWIEEEALMDTVTGVSGSGPAYVFHFVEALHQAGVKAGLPGDTAYALATQTVYGAAEMVKEGDATALREQVTSPNGTTQAGLDALMEEPHNLTALLEKTVLAAKKRSEEL